MTPSSPPPTYRVRMHVWQWLIVDATLDNEVAVEVRQGDPRGVADLGSSIRRAGWEQIPDWPQHGDGFANWPPPGRMVTMPLTASQWELVISSLRRWADVSEELNDPDSEEAAADSRAIADLAARQLTEQGWSPS